MESTPLEFEEEVVYSLGSKLDRFSLRIVAKEDVSFLVDGFVAGFVDRMF